MDVQNLSLLIAITAPVAALAALRVWLALHGERGSLLLPDRGEIEPTSCPACVLGAIVKAAARLRVEETASSAQAANDESVREAA